MKNLVLTLLSGCIIYVNSFAQSTTATNVWAPGRFIGYTGSSPLDFRTANIPRMKLNHNVTYSINGSNAARNGYLLLGVDMPLWPGGPNELYTNVGAFSLLHLSGNTGTFAQPNGHRSWMKTGITFTDNNDMSYIGLRQIGTGNDITETTITWTDNSGGGAYGPDDMVFRFTTGDGTITDDLGGSGLNGREIMRMNTNGNIGIGPRFSNDFQPKSILHQHQENAVSSWFQISNQNSAGTAQTTAPTNITGNFLF